MSPKQVVIKYHVNMTQNFCLGKNPTILIRPYTMWTFYFLETFPINDLKRIGCKLDDVVHYWSCYLIGCPPGVPLIERFDWWINQPASHAYLSVPDPEPPGAVCTCQVSIGSEVWPIDLQVWQWYIGGVCISRLYTNRNTHMIGFPL